MHVALYRAIRTLSDEGLAGAIALLDAILDDAGELYLTPSWSRAFEHVLKIAEAADAEQRIRDAQLAGGAAEFVAQASTVGGSTNSDTNSPMADDAAAILGGLFGAFISDERDQVDDSNARPAEAIPAEAQFEQPPADSVDESAGGESSGKGTSVDIQPPPAPRAPSPAADPDADMGAGQPGAPTRDQDARKVFTRIDTCGNCAKTFEWPSRAEFSKGRSTCNDCCGHVKLATRRLKDSALLSGAHLPDPPKVPVEVPVPTACEDCGKAFEQRALPRGGRKRRYCDDCRDARKGTNKAVGRAESLKPAAAEGGHPTTAELVEFFRGGDEEAFTKLHDRYRHKVDAAVSGFAGKVDTEAVLKEAWATWRATKFEAFVGGSLLAWMRVVVRNRCVEVIQRGTAAATTEPIAPASDPGAPANQLLEEAAGGEPEAAAGQAPDDEGEDTGDVEPEPQDLVDVAVPDAGDRSDRSRLRKAAPPRQPSQVTLGWTDAGRTSRQPASDASAPLAQVPIPSELKRGHCPSCGRECDLAAEPDTRRPYCATCGCRWVTPIIAEGIAANGQSFKRYAPAGWADDETQVKSGGGARGG